MNDLLAVLNALMQGSNIESCYTKKGAGRTEYHIYIEHHV